MIQNSTAPVHGIVIGRAYSSGFNILQACVVRIAYLNADMMCHASDMTGVRVDDKVSLKRTEKETVKVHEEFLKCLSKRSGQSVKRWRKWSLKQEYFTGRQAKKLGIVDKVTRPRKDFPII
jgi:ATP-dependent protease ClpP protease subunit